ncbi:MAG: hypothetical protein RL441_1253 [Actinomycetota bacterium]|jgi:hypothetical protein
MAMPANSESKLSQTPRAKAFRISIFTALAIASGGILLPLTPIWIPVANVAFGARTEDFLEIAQSEFDTLTNIAHGDASVLPFKFAENADEWARYAPTLQNMVSAPSKDGSERLVLERATRRDEYLTPILKVRLVDELSGQGGTVFISFHRVEGEWQVDSIWQPSQFGPEWSRWVVPTRP